MTRSLHREELRSYLDTLLNSSAFSDMCPNGLQIEGQDEVTALITAVTPSLDVIQEAVERGATALLTHHALLSDYSCRTITGVHKKKIELLVKHNISLFSYHLPLDAHEKFGNNALLCRLLGVVTLEPFVFERGMSIGWKGELHREREEMFSLIKEKINPSALILPFGPDIIRRIGVVSGGAQNNISDAIREGCDLYLTGEVSEHTYYIAKEEGIHFVAGGHHATEVFGVRELGEHIAQKFGIKSTFIDTKNPA